MTDKIFENQLKQFGDEAIVIERGRSTPAAINNEERTAAMIAVVKGLMDTVQGRQWVWEKLAFCQALGFVCDPEKPLTVSYFRGMQDVGLYLYQEINAVSPDMILTMNQEAAQRNMVSARKVPESED